MATTPLKAIRAKCLECSCGSSVEVKLCPIEDCPLYEFRFGKNPNIKLSDKQMAKKIEVAMQNMAKLQEKRREALASGRDD